MEDETAVRAVSLGPISQPGCAVAEQTLLTSAARFNSRLECQLRSELY